MKLLDPTDDQLNACFAEKVAGWTCVNEYPNTILGLYWKSPDGATFSQLRFTCSADAVMPWLEKCHSWNMQYDQGEIEELEVNLWCPFHGQFKGAAGLPKALVIALLRAHGVEVEFTK